MKIQSKNQEKIAISVLATIIILTSFYLIGIEVGNNKLDSNLTNEPASLTILAPVGKTVDVGGFEQVNWLSTNYTPSTVKVNLIRKVSDNPNRYEVVRSIASPTTNDGQAAWVPNVSDLGSPVSVEVGCNMSVNSCTAGNNLSETLAIVNTGNNSNLASTYDAILQLMNK